MGCGMSAQAEIDCNFVDILLRATVTAAVGRTSVLFMPIFSMVKSSDHLNARSWSYGLSLSKADLGNALRRTSHCPGLCMSSRSWRLCLFPQTRLHVP